MLKNKTLNQIACLIQDNTTFLLTTHKCCDGDGLGALLGMYHSLKKIKKKVRAVSVDPVPQKYQFLSPDKYTESFDNLKPPIQTTDVAMIFDTNDKRLIQPLYSELQQKCKKIIFIDHHPILKKGPKPTPESLIDVSSASTGELSYFLIQKLKIPWDTKIATALYTSILFDTQRFHFIENSKTSYQICADLYPYIKNHHFIYSQLFDIGSREKMNKLAQAIKKMEFLYNNQVVVLEISRQEMLRSQLDLMSACDFIDLALGVKEVKIAILIMKMSNHHYKISFRSKILNVSKLAEQFGGGGHKTASGATLKNYKKNIKKDILNTITSYIN